VAPTNPVPPGLLAALPALEALPQVRCSFEAGSFCLFLYIKNVRSRQLLLYPEPPPLATTAEGSRLFVKPVLYSGWCCPTHGVWIVRGD
jgi:hypothetical protein